MLRIWARFLLRRRCFQLRSFFRVELLGGRFALTFNVVFFDFGLSSSIFEQLAFPFWLIFSFFCFAELMKVLRSIVQLFTLVSVIFCSLFFVVHKLQSYDLFRNSLSQALVLTVLFISKDLLGIELSFKVFIFSDSCDIFSFFASNSSIILALSSIFFLKMIAFSSSSSIHFLISSILRASSSFWVTKTILNSIFFFISDDESPSIFCFGGYKDDFCQRSQNSQRSSSVSVRFGKQGMS